MKKKLLITATTSAALLLAASSSHAMNAKRVGQGFTDIMGDFTNAASNPALMTRYDREKDDFYTSFGLGVHVADPNDAIDSADDARDLSNKMDNIFDNYDISNPEQAFKSFQQDAKALQGHLKDISEDTLYLRQGIDFNVAIPNRYLSTSFFVSQRGRIGLKADYADADDNLLNDIIAGDIAYLDFDENLLQSRVSAAGYSVADAGFSFGREVSTENIPLLTSLGLGTNIKYQRLDVAGYSASISDYDEDDITSGDNHAHKNGFNADLGAVMTFDEDQRWVGSLAIRDLKRNSVTNDNGDTFKLDTRAIVGAGYQGDLFSLVGQVDLNKHGGMENILDDVQYASIGAELDLWKHAQLRAGYRTDLNNTEEDVITAGIGLSPFNLMSVDIAAFAGSDRNVGAVVQFGFRF